MKDSPDKNAITKFVNHLRETGYPDIRIDRWPDRENRVTPEIDAIAGKFAIEHTSIDTLSNQRKSDDWFLRIIGDLESELANKLTFNLMVRFEYEVFTQKHNWKLLHEALKRFIVEDTPTLGSGYHKLDDVPGISFTIHLDKSIESPIFGLRFARFSPQELSLGLPWCPDKKQPALPDDFRVHLDKKMNKLVKYKDRGNTTIFLIENPDFLKDHWTLLHWITETYPHGFPADVDQIWYAGRYNSDFKFLELTSDVQQEA